MLKSTMKNSRFNSYPNADVIANAGLNWLKLVHTLGQENHGQYKLCVSSDSPTLLASCFAACIMELFDRLPVATLREQRISYLQNCQHRDTGLFIDPLLKKKDITSDKHDWFYVTMQSTYFALNALDALGATPKYPLSFLEPYKDSDYLIQWLEQRNWADPWTESNNLMFIVCFLIYEWARSEEQRIKDTIDKCFNWLDEHQDPETGYWGTDKGANLFHGMAGAYHLYPFYLYLRRRINYIEKIIDNTLYLQWKDGLFVEGGGGGPCEDLDAIDILVKMSYLTNYKEKEVKKALAKAFHAILKNQNEDGSFCWRKKPVYRSWKRRIGELFGLAKLLGKELVIPKQYVYYSSWEKMPIEITEGDLWSTWFRPIALALISVRCPGEFLTEIDWKFHRLPALGWHDENAINEVRKLYY